MGVENCRCRRIHRPRRFRRTRQKRLGRLVCEIRRCRRWNGDAAAFFYRNNGHRFGGSYSDKAGSPRAFVDGVLGFLDSAFKTDRWHADLGFYRTVGELGSAFGVVALDWLAQNPKAVVEIIKFEWKSRFGR